jgi:BatD DUF11 like domain
MKNMFLIFLLLFSNFIFADEVKVEINPTKPVAGEVFQAYFRIFTQTDEEPSINFSPSNVEVVGKSNQGISTRTIYANGKLTVTREITVAYDLVASRPGAAALRDITVQAGVKTLRHPTINLNVLKEPEELADVFVMADVPKKNLFVGEGIVVRYYLYSKVPVSNLDIKKYPKLNNFLKRFLQEPERTERVSVDGQIYMRTQIYAARLYPEKTGDLKIDSLSLSATYSSSRSNDPFGAFGMGRDMRSRTINSETIKVEVRPLPQPVPTHFTGLVGKHEFQLQAGESKLIVNEPLEIKLTVSGAGALENLEAPELLKHQGLEEFETNGDLKISAPDLATKTFDYTFLAKQNLNLPAKDLVLSYFDPESQRYVPTTLNLPVIVVAGGEADRPQKNTQPSPVEERKMKPALKLKELAGPVTVSEWQWKNWLPLINLSLAGLALLISIGWAVKTKSFKAVSLKHDVPSSFKKGQFEFGEFVKWMTPLITETGKSPLLIIKDSPLPEESKRYFIDLLTANDYKEYSSRKSQMDFKYQSSHFKELGRYIERARHESSSQPS